MCRKRIDHLSHSTISIVSIVTFLFTFNYSLFAQDEETNTIRLHKKLLFLSAGMGVSMVNSSSFNDYLREEVPFANKDSVKTFSVGLEVFGGFEVQFTKKFSLKLDYSYFFKTYTYNQFSYTGYTFDYSYMIHQPYVMAYYILPGKHYAFRFGGGAGFLYSILRRTDVGADDVKYTSSGLGLKGEIVFSADLSKRMSSYLSGFLVNTWQGKLKDANNAVLKSPVTNTETDLSSFSIGVRLGASFKLN